MHPRRSLSSGPSLGLCATRDFFARLLGVLADVLDEGGSRKRAPAEGADRFRPRPKPRGQKEMLFEDSPCLLVEKEALACWGRWKRGLDLMG